MVNSGAASAGARVGAGARRFGVGRRHVRLLHLYRPHVPSVRAQALQVVHTCHALAARGHEVTLLADRAAPEERGALDGAAGVVGDATEALRAYGLDHPKGLDLRVAPTSWAPGAGWWFRVGLLRWAAGGGVVYARAKRYVSLVPRRIPVVVEAHELDSALAAERGEDPAPWRRLEASVFARAAAIVTNGEGTRRVIEAAWPALPPIRAIPNATRADRARPPRPGPVPTVGYTGSPRSWKGLADVFASLPGWPAGVRLELVGGAPEGPVPAGVIVSPAVGYAALPERLAGFSALLLPLADNLYGRALANPLKLWDYLATGLPIVAADLPTVREVAGDRPFYFRPGDPTSLAEAVGRALAAGRSPPLLRTWDQRAAEIEAFLAEVL